MGLLTQLGPRDTVYRRCVWILNNFLAIFKHFFEDLCHNPISHFPSGAGREKRELSCLPPGCREEGSLEMG